MCTSVIGNSILSMALRPADTSAAHAAHSLSSVAAVTLFRLRKSSAARLRCSVKQHGCSTGLWGSNISCSCTTGHRTHLGAHVSRARLVAARALAVPALTTPAVGPDPWHTLAVLSTCAAVSQLLEAHTKLSAPLLALTTALAAAALGLLPPVSPVYDAVWRYLMPLAVALYLLDHDISSLARSGGKVLVSFLLGAGTMVAGAWCAWHLLSTAALGAHGAQLACCLLASYIGGSVNFAAVASATGLPSALMPAAVAADNLAMLVLLGIMMAAPARSIAALIATKQPATPSRAAAGRRLSPPAALPSHRGSSASRSGWGRPSSRLRDAHPAVGLDGQPLLTQPPDPADLAACMTASAQGRATVGSSIYRSSGSYKQHALSHRAVGQHAPGGRALSTPSPSSTATLGTPAAAAGVSKPGQVASRSYSSQGNSSSKGDSSSNDSSSIDSSSSSTLSRKCGGCRASGVTALDANPLLTRAPAMTDAVTNINAARVGKQQLRTGPPPGSSSSSNGGITLDFPDDGVVGCGGCEEALNAMAEASNRGSPFDSSSSASRSPVRSGALALDGGLLLTDEPSEDQVAAAVAAAKAGRKVRSAHVSVSDSALSSLASTDADDLELVVRFNWKEFQENLKREQQLQQQQQQQEEAKRQQQQQEQAVLPDSWEKISVSSSVDSSSGDSDSETWGLPDGSTAPAAVAAATVTASTSGTAVAGIGGVSLTSSSGAAALAAAAVSCAAGQAAATSLGVPALQLLMVSCCAVGLSVVGHMLFRAFSNQQQQIAPPSGAGPYAGASHLGQLLMGVFFATLGASCCCSWSSLLAAAPQFAFVIIMVCVHWFLLAVIGRALGAGGLNLVSLSDEVLMVGSAANVGGPATAAALASAKGWEGLVQPALLCGSLGYALGTAGGMLLARGLGVLCA